MHRLLADCISVYKAAAIRTVELCGHYDIICRFIYITNEKERRTKKVELNILLVLIAKLALLMAKLGAGAASFNSSYQPDLPSQLITKE